LRTAPDFKDVRVGFGTGQRHAEAASNRCFFGITPRIVELTKLREHRVVDNCYAVLFNDFAKAPHRASDALHETSLGVAAMSGHTQVDALILGSGTGGTSLALHLARSGQRVAVVEKRWIGGSCPNVSCLPTKNEIWSAKIADSMRRFTGEFGHVARSVAVDMTQVRQRKREMVRALNVAVLDSFDANRVQLIMGEGRFVAPRAVGVHLKDGGTSVVSAERVFLDLGTHAAMPDIAGLPATQPMTHIEILELDRVPPHLIVLGGGYVGLELAQAFRRFGSRVTIVEHGVQLAGREDPDVGAEIISRNGLRNYFFKP
jgi:pyruvate/2-oxoglutarate dehydrogenase complex dihydrolipoamide dehydrogenase (E3) component